MTRGQLVYLVAGFVVCAFALTIAVVLCEISASADRRARRWAPRDDSMRHHPSSRGRT